MNYSIRGGPFAHLRDPSPPRERHAARSSRGNYETSPKGLFEIDLLEVEDGLHLFPGKDVAVLVDIAWRELCADPIARERYRVASVARRCRLSRGLPLTAACRSELPIHFR